MSFAASQPFPLQDLARNQATIFRHERRKMYFVGALSSGLALVAGGFGERVVLHFVHKLAQQVVWFRGAFKSVHSPELRRALDPQDSLREALDDMERDLIEIRDQANLVAAKLRATDGRASGRVRNAFDRLASTAVELKEEVRAFKGAVQAHDANVGALMAAKGKVAMTPESLQADLEGAIG